LQACRSRKEFRRRRSVVPEWQCAKRRVEKAKQIEGPVDPGRKEPTTAQ
ncbi:hypothetical protein L195_g062540, partial [Trifolium pratense]